MSRFVDLADGLHRIDYNERVSQSLHHLIEKVPLGLNTCDAASSLDGLRFFFASPDRTFHIVDTKHKTFAPHFARLIFTFFCEEAQAHDTRETAVLVEVCVASSSIRMRLDVCLILRVEYLPFSKWHFCWSIGHWPNAQVEGAQKSKASPSLKSQQTSREYVSSSNIVVIPNQKLLQQRMRQT